MTRKLALAFAGLASLLACGLLGCGDGSRGAGPVASSSAAPASSGDVAAKDRLVVVGGAATEIVFALGAGPRVVATDTSGMFPPEANALPKVGYMRQLSAEGILGLRPTQVLLSEESGPPAALAQLEQAKVRVVEVPGATNLEQAVARVRAVAEAVGEKAAGDALATKLEADALAARDRARAGAKKTRVLFLYARGPGTMFVGGKGTSAAAMLDIVGAVNAGDGVEGFASLTAESAAAAAPEVILVPTKGLASLGGEEGLLKQPGLAETPAGKAKRIVSVDDSLLLGFGPRLPEAIDLLAKALAGAPP
jgi:iron complex transport system substrate-binding protein